MRGSTDCATRSTRALTEVSTAAGIARGFIAPGYERLARRLEHVVSDMGEVGCAVAAYRDGVEVANLWCGMDGEEPWTEATLAVVFSATKGAAALCAQVLADRGLLDVDAPVVKYWPEYGAAGKEATLVRHFLEHTAGVLTVPRYWEHIGADGRGLSDWENMISLIEAAPPSWPPGSQAGYHAYTYGFLVGELVRRVDGRTLGRFFAEEVAAPLGLEFWIGLPEAMLPRVARVLPPAPIDLETLPEPQRAIADFVAQVFAQGRDAVRGGRELSLEALPWSAFFMPPDADTDGVDTVIAALMNEPWMQTRELPNGNGIGTARALARMYSCLAQGGELDGVRLVSEASIAQFSRERTNVNGLPMALGYHRLGPDWGGAIPSDAAFGHGGAGGALAFADPVRRVSFAFVKNQMSLQPTARELVRALYSCLD